MALSVMLVLLAIVQGQIRGRLVAWLALATLAFEPIPAGVAINARSWSDHAASALPLIFIGVASFSSRTTPSTDGSIGI